jgi:hypothetical protein
MVSGCPLLVSVKQSRCAPIFRAREVHPSRFTASAARLTAECSAKDLVVTNLSLSPHSANSRPVSQRPLKNPGE